MIKKLLVVLALSFPIVALADSKINAKASMDCELKSKTQLDIVTCLLKKQGDTRTPLNKAYKKAAAIAAQDKGFAGTFEQLQKNWVSLRHDQCKLEAKMYGRDSDAYLIEKTCINYMNRQRTAYLNSIESAN